MPRAPNHTSEEVGTTKIGVLGTGSVGRSNAARLAELGHDISMGTRDVSKAMSKVEKDAMGNPPLKDWLKQNPKVKLATFSDAAGQAELIINAIKGEHSLEALRLAGEQNLNGKVLMDISNPLDFSKGMPPTLLVSNSDSLRIRDGRCQADPSLFDSCQMRFLDQCS